MDMNEYQKRAKKTAKYGEYRLNKEESWSSKIHGNLVYPTWGLSSEVGELLGKLKKNIRDDTEIDHDALKGELGDILWYVAEIASVLDLSLDDVAQANVDKLESRVKRDKISGSGDNR